MPVTSIGVTRDNTPTEQIVMKYFERKGRFLLHVGRRLTWCITMCVLSAAAVGIYIRVKLIVQDLKQ